MIGFGGRDDLEAAVPVGIVREVFLGVGFEWRLVFNLSAGFWEI